MSYRNCVIISYNTVDTLRDSIHLLAKDDINIVVVDNGSDDGSAQYLAAEPRVTATLNGMNYGSAVARNQGVASIDGDVLMLDADVVYLPGSYDVLLNQMHADHVQSVGMDPDCCTNDYADVWTCPPAVPKIKDAWIAYTQYGLFSRAVFEVCRFDDNYGPGWGFEDDDLFMQMQHHGMYAKQLQWKYYHRRRSSLVNLAKRQQSSRLKERRSYFNHKWYTVSPDTTKSFIVSALNGEGRGITRGAVDALISSGHKIPHAINRLALKLWQYADAHNLKEVSTAAVESMVDSLIERQSLHYRWYWSKELSSFQRVGLQAIANMAMGMFSSEMLEDNSLRGHRGLVTSLVASNVLDECSSLYYFVDPLFAAWITRNSKKTKSRAYQWGVRMIKRSRRSRVRFPDFWPPENPSVYAPSTIVRAEPCHLIYTPDQVTCTRLKDGVTVAIDSLDARALSSMAAFKSRDRHLKSLCVQIFTSLVLQIVHNLVIPRSCALWLQKVLSDQVAGTQLFPKKIVRNASAAIDSLQEKGLLLSEHNLLSCLNVAAAPNVGSRHISDVGLFTSSRSISLVHCLATLTRNVSPQEPCTNIFIIDESEESGSGIGRAIGTYKQSKGLSVRHCSTENRLHLVETLAAQTSIARDVIEFAIVPESLLPTRGGSRNFVSLVTAGRHLLQISDDIYLHSSSPKAELNQGRTTQTTAPVGQKMSDEGWLSLHKEVLGRSVAEIARLAPSVLADLGDEEIMNLRIGHPYVGITSTGRHVHMPIDILLTEPRPFVSRAKTAQHLAEGELIEAGGLFRLSRVPVFNPFAYGCDNKHLMPPYFPMGIGTEVTFANLYLRSNSQVWIGHLSGAVERHIDPSIAVCCIHPTRRCRLSELVTLCISSVSMLPETAPERGLRTVGEHLGAIAKLSRKAFQSYLHTLLMNQRKQMFEHIAESREANSWERLHLPTFDDIVPVDLATVLGAADALWKTQELLGMYGQVLCGWQALWDASRFVRESEITDFQNAVYM